MIRSCVKCQLRHHSVAPMKGRTWLNCSDLLCCLISLNSGFILRPASGYQITVALSDLMFTFHIQNKMNHFYIRCCICFEYHCSWPSLSTCSHKVYQLFYLGTTLQTVSSLCIIFCFFSLMLYSPLIIFMFLNSVQIILWFSGSTVYRIILYLA